MNITELSHKERSLLFAKLSQIAYSDKEGAAKAVKKLGFKECEFYNRDGAQAYRFATKTDMVIACRGTQPSEFNDIKADLRAIPTLSETVSRVHKGFKCEVDELWPMILEDLDDATTKRIWVCGHSLGGAMATIIAGRLERDIKNLPSTYVDGLYTYGSPRVGWRRYVNSMKVPHHRWRNNNDIVTAVPPVLFGYVHHGELQYINHLGDVSIGMTYWNRAIDKLKGVWKGMKIFRIDSFADHSIGEYISHLEKWQD